MSTLIKVRHDTFAERREGDKRLINRRQKQTERNTQKTCKRKSSNWNDKKTCKGLFALFKKRLIYPRKTQIQKMFLLMTSLRKQICFFSSKKTIFDFEFCFFLNFKEKLHLIKEFVFLQILDFAFFGFCSRTTVD